MIRLMSLIAFFLLLPLFTLDRMSASAAVVINEILPKPNDETSEWIELYNNSADPVSLAGWVLENVQGNAKIYTIPDGIVIPAGHFWAFDQAETGINLYNEGDTVKLFDNSTYQVDSQSYPSILGYNTSMGRSSDGAGVWTTCTAWTKYLPNKCPPPTNTPTPTSTPMPTRRPTSSPSLTPTSIPSKAASTPTPLFTAAGQPAQSQVLGLTGESTPPNDSKESKIRRFLGFASFGVAALAALGLIGRRFTRHHRESEKQS